MMMDFAAVGSTNCFSFFFCFASTCVREIFCVCFPHFP